MRNKLVYPCSKKKTQQQQKPMLWDSMNSWKTFSASCWLKVFSLQKVVKMLEEVVVGGQVNMADEAKLHSLIHSTFEVLVVQHAAVYSCREELGPFC